MKDCQDNVYSLPRGDVGGGGGVVQEVHTHPLRRSLFSHSLFKFVYLTSQGQLRFS